MKAIILARVSDKKQDSNEAQVNRVTEYVRNKGLQIWKTFELEESSTKGDRKQFERVVKIIKASKEPVALVADTVDRIQRSFRDSVKLDDLRKQGQLEIHFYRENLIIHAESNSADLLRWDMAVMFARGYVLQLSDNVKRKLEQMRNNGDWTNKSPIGYIRITVQRQKTLIPDPVKAPLVRRVFDLYSTGAHSINTIHNIMVQERLTFSSGKIVTRSVIEKILKNPFYYGVMISKNKRLPHKYSPLISKTLFDKCQELLGRWNKKKFQAGRLAFMLRGVLTCGNCGCTLSPEIKKQQYIYYSCTNAKKQCSRRTYYPEAVLAKPILEKLEEFSQVPEDFVQDIVADLKAMMKINASNQMAYVTGLHNERTDLLRKENKVTELLIEEEIDREYFRAKRTEFKVRMHEIELELAELEAENKKLDLNAETVLKAARNMQSTFLSATGAQKNVMVKSMVQNYTVSEKNIGFTMTEPFQALYDVVCCPTLLAARDRIRNTNWSALAEMFSFGSTRSPDIPRT